MKSIPSKTSAILHAFALKIALIIIVSLEIIKEYMKKLNNYIHFKNCIHVSFIN